MLPNIDVPAAGVDAPNKDPPVLLPKLNPVDVAGVVAGLAALAAPNENPPEGAAASFGCPKALVPLAPKELVPAPNVPPAGAPNAPVPVFVDPNALGVVVAPNVLPVAPNPGLGAPNAGA